MLAADVCEHTVSTDPTIELVTTILPDSLNKHYDLKSCWMRRTTNSKSLLPSCKFSKCSTWSSLFLSQWCLFAYRTGKWDLYLYCSVCFLSWTGGEWPSLPDHRGTGVVQLGTPRLHLHVPLQSAWDTRRPLRMLRRRHQIIQWTISVVMTDNCCSHLLLPVPDTPNTFLFLFLTLKQYSWRLETDGSSGFWVVWKNTDSVSLQSFHILEFQYVHPAGAGDTSVLSDQMLCQRDVISCGKMTHWQLWCDV